MYSPFATEQAELRAAEMPFGEMCRTIRMSCSDRDNSSRYPDVAVFIVPSTQMHNSHEP